MSITLLNNVKIKGIQMLRQSSNDFMGDCYPNQWGVTRRLNSHGD